MMMMNDTFHIDIDRFMIILHANKSDIISLLFSIVIGESAFIAFGQQSCSHIHIHTQHISKCVLFS